MQHTFENFAEWQISENGAGEGAADRQLEMFVDMLQQQAGGPLGYRLRRIILTNFWLYGKQEFEIPHGRLFLAGENASGKSTVLTAALPLALDGDLRPNRLDTFGGRERHIQYYVLGGADSATPFNHERRTSYIALEFEWLNPDAPPIAPELRQRWENGDREKTRFLTIGISLAGNLNASDRIRPLRFLITDGSRLGYELDTIYETGNKRDKRAYDHPRFKQILEGHGIICDSQAEYERQVARYLFGFNDEKDFQKLIDLLLTLRRPNLSSELSFSRVHDYLKQSLRKISGETTSRVIGTIDRIDAINSEIERIQESFDSANRLHLAQQQVTLIRAQLAACEYTGAHLVESSAQSRVTKLRKDLFAAENERKRAETRSQALRVEQFEVNGQIKALEASEGLEVAKRLASARDRLHEAETQLKLQQGSMESARQSLTELTGSLVRQRAHFESLKVECLSHLDSISSIASEEALWEAVSLQLQEASHQLSSISTDITGKPDTLAGVATLIEAESEDRIAWLRKLEGLHQEREKLDSKVQYARTLETTRFQELDEARHRFDSAQERANVLQRNFETSLEQFFTEGNFNNHLDIMDDTTLDQENAIDEESLVGRVVEQLALAIKRYQQIIDELDRELAGAANLAQGELNELQLLAGSKQHELSEIQTLYEQKLSEPEFTPSHSDRRTRARARLAERGIPALPLYMLLDFAPEIDNESNEAGRIEYTLEDAGLLDALVVAPQQVDAADELLAAEGLSDCRLDIEAFHRLKNENPRNIDHVQLEAGGLCFDTSIRISRGDDTDWDSIIATILQTLSYSEGAQETGPVRTKYSANQDGSWSHGLLTGHAGGGEARYIGRATRLRIRQRELEELKLTQTKLEEELQALYVQLAYYEHQLSQIQEKQIRIRKILPESGIEEIHAELSQARLTLDELRSKYQKARLQTQEARQAYNRLLAQLERECMGIAPLASDAKHVQSTLMGIIKLKNQSTSLQLQMRNIINTWEEYQRTRETEERAKMNETNIATLYERIHQQWLETQSEANELLLIAESSNVEELSERLRLLHEQYEILSTQLDETKTSFISADVRANSTQEHLEEAEEYLQRAQYDSSEQQRHFDLLLLEYPTTELLEIIDLANRGEYVRAAHKLLSETIRENEVALLKQQLEEQYRDIYNALSRTFNREQPLLLEYGPDMDDQGHVVFLNENKSRPVDLLELLSDRIEMQKMLLRQEERQLFEDFLLQEIAEAIRTHILEAEEWVQQVNGVLKGLPMIGEHYALQWKPPAEYDLTKLGSHLAQHYKLLRKQAQTLTTEETEALMNAFRQEIEAARLRQQENPETNFMETLEQVFDYREWFHFDVLVAPIGGQWHRLTDRMAGTRSGAEQLFALYIPLFAALAALYRSAAPGAPRLLALDEAFDKVSVVNTQRIMEFLVSQDFQWIMTGPQISGTGAKIPACARYLMIHEKGSPVATASASFWSDNQSLQGTISEKK
ncbi:MAG TPA: SbcC/MukB-like Walker B domain-containing protein [Ktedonobacteraceae bacterium]|nr:SbcC/MukB-like Walker B domain-containing protein [Ktedonobacteraceae bacterium]